MKNAPRGILWDYERFVSSGVAPAAGRSELKRFKSLTGPECEIQTDFYCPTFTVKWYLKMFTFNILEIKNTCITLKKIVSVYLYLEFV